ncbi:MAG: iron-containing alcohol dehydrogenase [Erysipelotrichaceae bacterium]
MLGNFTYCNPTKLHFGPDAVTSLHAELAHVGPRIALVYGGGSIKKLGIYQEIVEILHANNKTIVEIEGVMPNPTLDKLYEGIAIVKEEPVDFILAVGGGSVIDYAKALSVSIHCKQDPWDTYFVRFLEPTCEIVPVGCVLTMVGTGSEMNAGSVITNTKTNQKIGHVFQDPAIMPRFAILNPMYTLSLPPYQMVAGWYDIFNHICEQYFSGSDTNVSDDISEALMLALIRDSRIALKEPQNYEARSNIMWTSTWALNTLTHQGKPGDWMVHMIGQAIGGACNATHGMTLSAVSLSYYRTILPYGLPKFKRFAQRIWNVASDEMSDLEIAQAGLNRMEAWMCELGLIMDITTLGIQASDLPGIVEHIPCLEGGYHTCTKEELLKILENASK